MIKNIKFNFSKKNFILTGARKGIGYSVLKKFNLPLRIKKNSKSKKEIIEIILNNINKDKKKNYLGVRFILLENIGKPKIVSNLGNDFIRESISKHIY